MRTRDLVCVAIGFLISVMCVGQVHGEAPGDAILLQYKPQQNVSYLVDRTLTQVKRHKNNETQTLHERAVITYGKVEMLKSGNIQVTPKMTIVGLEGNMKNPGSWGLKTIPPLRKKYPTGKLTKFVDGDSAPGRLWRVDWIYRAFDVFPMFPEASVALGQTWLIKMELHFPAFPGYASPVTIKHRLSGFETIEERRLAVIEYSFSGVFESAKHPEAIETEYLRQTRPKYVLSGQGTVHFDPERGILVRKQQQAELSIKTTREPDRAFVRRYPHWAGRRESVSRSRLTAELISDEQASDLIKEAEEAREAEQAGTETKAAPTPKRTYYVTRTAVRNDKLRKREKTLVDRALVGYGAGKPQVIYVDEQKQPLEPQRSAGAKFQPFADETLSLRGKLPTFGGPGSDMGWPVPIVANAFDFLPMRPDGELAPEKRWHTEIVMTFGGLPKTKFTARIQQLCKGYEWKQNRRCLKVEYIFRGEFKSADHPELFSAEELKEHKVEYSLYGKGVAHYDPKAQILVGKFQTISWHSTYQRLRKLADGNVGWVTTTDESVSVEIGVSLQEAE